MNTKYLMKHGWHFETEYDHKEKRYNLTAWKNQGDDQVVKSVKAKNYEMGMSTLCQRCNIVDRTVWSLL